MLRAKRRLFTSIFILIGIFAGFYAFALPRREGSLGQYWNGSLDSDAFLADKEKGLLKIFVERNRRYGNDVLVRLLKDLGTTYRRVWTSPPAERLQIGDLSQKGGGQISRHHSHQNGLDVDIVYLRKNRRETLPQRGAEASFDESFVVRGSVSKNFDTRRNWWLFAHLMQTGLVDRIFVDKEIKRYLCRAVLSAPETLGEAKDLEKIRVRVLRLLRPYPEHMDHFHMRLLCPPDNSKCVASKPVPSGPGCTDAEIEESIKEELQGGV